MGAVMLLTDWEGAGVILGGKAYDAERIKVQDAARNGSDKPNHKVRHCFSKPLYEERHHIERFFNRTKHFRRIATYFENHAANQPAVIKLAAIRIWLCVNQLMAKNSWKRLCFEINFDNRW